MKHFTQNVIFLGTFFHVLLQASFEDQQKNDETKTKTSRFGLGWWDSEPWIAEPLPPAPIAPPPQPRPPQPPAPLRPPQPPAPLRPPQPPAPLQPAEPPAPLPPQPVHINEIGNLPALQDNGHLSRNGVHAEDIHCERSNGVTLLSALVIPPPEFTAPPVFEDAVGSGHEPQGSLLSDCAMRPGGGPRTTFAMHVQHFSRCGVRVQQGSDGKEWVSVTLRFPLMPGLRMADDEYVMILCRPQERTAISNHVIDMRGTARTEGRSLQTKKVFRSGPRDVACRMSLMAKPPGGQTFNREMKSGAIVKVGQQLQLRGAVREGDGWKFAVLKDVVISRTSGKSVGHARGSSSGAQRTIHPHFFSDTQVDHPLSNSINNIDIGENNVYNDRRSGHRPGQGNGSPESAYLVFSDGCRNPNYRPIAPHHPYRDNGSPLVVSFTFSAFMFQDMLDGESLRLSAQMVACAELDDCQQALCMDDGQGGYGKRKRRHTDDIHGRTENFTENFELSVALNGFSKTPIMAHTPENEAPMGSPPAFSNCRNIIISVSLAAFIFSLTTTIAASIALAVKRKKLTKPPGKTRMTRTVKIQLPYDK